MKIISLISTILIPFIFFIVILFGIKEKKNVYELFKSGIEEGLNIVIKLFPTLLAIFLAVGMLRASGIFELIGNKVGGNIIPSELIPLAILKPISGSASIAMGTEIIKNNGPDSLTGKMAATIMASTETTVYVIAVYTSHLKIKKTNKVLFIALIADAVGIISSIFLWKIIEK